MTGRAHRMVDVGFAARPQLPRCCFSATSNALSTCSRLNDGLYDSTFCRSSWSSLEASDAEPDASAGLPVFLPADGREIFRGSGKS